MPIRTFRLGEEPPEPAPDDASAEECIEMLRTLTSRMLEIAGTTLPAYSRAEMPVRVIRRGIVVGVAAHCHRGVVNHEPASHSRGG